MKKLKRPISSTIGGVCEGIGNYIGIDGTIIKLIFFGLLFTPIPIAIIYLILWFFIPKEEF
jgi:phage shock protein PspC (stress-responsive transcriptional regulator)